MPGDPGDDGEPVDPVHPENPREPNDGAVHRHRTTGTNYQGRGEDP